MGKSMPAQPFRIHIPQQALDDLQTRLKQTRWTDQVEGAGWDYGANLDYLKELIAYWQSGFDWGAQEAKLNQFPHFCAEIDGLGVHFIHARGKGSNPLPILLAHGWPSSFFEMLKLIPLLTDPANHGGDPADSFDVIIPSPPGFGFSDRPHERGIALDQTADLWARLMTEVLGYPRFAATGEDLGAMVLRQLALHDPKLLVGLHLTYIGYASSLPKQDNLSEVEQNYLNTTLQWTMQEGAYALIQSTKPQTLAYSLNDSPVGLAAWLVEKFRAWSDCDGDVERRFSKDDLLTNIMIYWVTETINSSMRMYYEIGHGAPALKPGQRIEVPTGLALFPKDINPPPREWVERFFAVTHWTEMPRGGHFAAFEEPDLYAEDVRTFFRPLRA